MLEKFALLKMALCSAPVVTIDSSVRPGVSASATIRGVFPAAGSIPGFAMVLPNSNERAADQ
jgi:hypothetical protein